MPGPNQRSVTLGLSTFEKLEKLSGIDFRSIPGEIDWLVTKRLVEIEETSKLDELRVDVRKIFRSSVSRGDVDDVPEARVETPEEKKSRELNEKLARDLEKVIDGEGL